MEEAWREGSEKELAPDGLWSPGVCELDGEAVLVELRRVHCHQTGEALACGIDDVQIAVGAIIPTQANVGAGALIVGGVHLEQRREREEAGKGIIRLEAAEHNGEVSGPRREWSPRGIGRRAQSEAVPLFRKAEG